MPHNISDALADEILVTPTRNHRSVREEHSQTSEPTGPSELSKSEEIMPASSPMPSCPAASTSTTSISQMPSNSHGSYITPDKKRVLEPWESPPAIIRPKRRRWTEAYVERDWGLAALREHPFWRMTDANNNVLRDLVPENVTENEAQDDEVTITTNVLGIHISVDVDENVAQDDEDTDTIVIHSDIEDQNEEDINSQDDESEDSPSRPSDVSVYEESGDEAVWDDKLFLFDAGTYLQDKTPGEDQMIEFLAQIQKEFSGMVISDAQHGRCSYRSWRHYLEEALAERDMEVQQMEQHVARIRQAEGS